jgi:cell division protein FtsB
MAAAARHARSVAPAPRYEQDARAEAPAYAYRAPRTRRRAAQRSRLTRAFVAFVVVLTVLAVGRVALSFAVVQKTLQTDAVVSEERRVSAKNDQLESTLADLGSTLRIRHIAQSQLGLVDAGSHVSYPEALLPRSTSQTGPETASTR